jgi:hypothetical protein
MLLMLVFSFARGASVHMIEGGSLFELDVTPSARHEKLCPSETRVDHFPRSGHCFRTVRRLVIDIANEFWEIAVAE